MSHPFQTKGMWLNNSLHGEEVHSNKRRLKKKKHTCWWDHSYKHNKTFECCNVLLSNGVINFRPVSPTSYANDEQAQAQAMWGPLWIDKLHLLLFYALCGSHFHYVILLVWATTGLIFSFFSLVLASPGGLPRKARPLGFLGECSWIMTTSCMSFTHSLIHLLIGCWLVPD